MKLLPSFLFFNGGVFGLELVSFIKYVFPCINDNFE